ncbi:MAG: hypothetical protein JO267_01015 [Alphaproteobacteria bacterium]|nr:hypothetical protein [Alphaproteobacteria bacterium]
MVDPGAPASASFSPRLAQLGAARVWAVLQEVGFAIAGKVVLEYAPGAASLSGALQQAGAGALHRIEAVPSEGQSASEPRRAGYDVIVSVGGHAFLEPEAAETALAWFYDNLAPEGSLVVTTPTIFADLTPDLGGVLRTPLAHLLFPRFILDEHLAARGEAAMRLPAPYCGATWLMLFHSAGFAIDHFVRHTTEVPEEILQRFADKLGRYEPQELRTSAVTAILRRPAQLPDLSPIAIARESR